MEAEWEGNAESEATRLRLMQEELARDKEVRAQRDFGTGAIVDQTSWHNHDINRGFQNRGVHRQNGMALSAPVKIVDMSTAASAAKNSAVIPSFASESRKRKSTDGRSKDSKKSDKKRSKSKTEKKKKKKKDKKAEKKKKKKKKKEQKKSQRTSDDEHRTKKKKHAKKTKRKEKRSTSRSSSSSGSSSSSSSSRRSSDGTASD